MESQGTQNSQNNLLKKNKVGRLTLPDLKTDYKGKLIKTVWPGIRADIQSNKRETKAQK